MTYRILSTALLMGAALAAGCARQEKGDRSATEHIQQTPAPSDNSKALNAYFNRVFYRKLERYPQLASSLGTPTHNDRWDPISDSAREAELKIVKQELDSLSHFQIGNLDVQTQQSYRLFEMERRHFISMYEYRYHNYPVNTQEGPHTDVPTFLINIHEIKTRKDAEDYIARLNGVKPLFNDLLAGMKVREEKKIIPPKFVFPKVIKACKNIVTGKPFAGKGESPMWEDFVKKTNALKISTQERDSLKTAAKTALLNSVKPAYDDLTAYLTQLDKKADTVVGAWSFPNGDRFYALKVKEYTTTGMTPDEVYAFGEKEVARIHDEIRAIMKKLNYKGSLQEFFRFMTDPKNRRSFLANNESGKKQYLALATQYIENMKGRLDELFLTKPKAPIVVKAVEKYRESSAGTAFYEHPSLDGSLPGRFYANLYDMNQSPIYQLEALAYHEGIPGHHMQIAIAQEMQGIPEFRKHADYTAYIEGWGLYSELVPKEIGLYKDPYSDFGRLSMELLRAARCVVDPGIHAKKWSRKQAIQWFSNNTAEPADECVNAIERYITWPGQATAYMVGKQRILELRERAKKELGDKFDIREFHDVVLLSGALPLDMLEENVKAYIRKKH